jgi:predicted negative regulator of RcsB-dependent stress response
VAQHILRRDLKKDEIREKFVSGVESVASHQQALWIVITAALVVALAIFGWNSYARRQTAKASAALDDATKIFQARIRTPGEPLDPTEITYLDEKNKFADADKKFLAVAAQFGRTKPGQMARYYAALSEVQLKQYGDAEKNLGQVISGNDAQFGGPRQIPIGRSVPAGK